MEENGRYFRYDYHYVTRYMLILVYQKLIRGWKVQLEFIGREYSLLPYLETLVTDIHFQQNGCCAITMQVF